MKSFQKYSTGYKKSEKTTQQHQKDMKFEKEYDDYRCVARLLKYYPIMLTS